MKFRLSHQIVLDVGKHALCFHYRNTKLMVSERQLLNLNDYIRHMHNYRRLHAIPLGQSLWLYLKPNPQLADRCQSIRFSPRCWKKYIRHIHHRVLSFMQHASYRAGDQRNARRRCRRSYQSQRCSSTLSSQQALSPSPTYARDQDTTRPQSAVIPVRQTTDSRQPFSFRRAVNGLRNRSYTTQTQASLSPESVEIDQYGGSCSIEASCGPSTD